MKCNVYEDAGYSDPRAMLVKADLSIDIEESVKARGLTIPEAAKTCGISPVRLRRILTGQFRDENIEFLIGCLQQLGRDVAIQVQPLDPSKRGPGEFQLIPPLVVH